MINQYSLHDADAILLYKVGPVLCCSPTFPVETVMLPPHLTRTPGTSTAEPGVFKSAYGIVRVADLRVRFGVDAKVMRKPGRIVVAEISGGHAGLWVDEILDVIQRPEKGWQRVPPHISAKLFAKTLLYENEIWLYSDFETLYHHKQTGYLRQHIEMLEKQSVETGQLKKQMMDAAPTRQAIKTRVTESAAQKPSEVPTTQPVNRFIPGTSNAIPEPRHRTQNMRRPTRETIHKPDLHRNVAEYAGRASYQSPRKSLEKRSPVTASLQSTSVRTPSPAPAQKPAATSMQSPQPASAMFAWMVIGALVLASLVLLFYLDEILFSEPIRPLSVPVVEHERLPVPDILNQTEIAENPPPDKEMMQQTEDTEPPKAVVRREIVSDEHPTAKAVISRDAEGVMIVLDDGVDTEPEKNTDPVNQERNQGPGEQAAAGLETEQVQRQPVKQPRAANPVVSREVIHIVVKGDTLWDIAKHYVQNPYRYPELAKLSKIKNPDLIYPGEKVRIIKK